MAQLADLKANIDQQFRASLDVVGVAKQLNALRLQLEQDGKIVEANAARAAVEQLAEISERLTESARRSGRTLAETIRQSW
ncbi:MAG: hypothetical protein ACOYOH_11465 [Paracraurococcus sp.]